VSVAPAARAQAVGGEGFAIVVGSNPGGPGQEALQYAEDDASRVADLLVELGGYRAEHVQRLLRPSADELTAAIGQLRAELAPRAERGEQTRFFFYYSGHARADALNLGRQELPLSELRARLQQLPATVSMVVLDACQSGAFSRVKGAGPAADFSFNSVERLRRSARGWKRLRRGRARTRACRAKNSLSSFPSRPPRVFQGGSRSGEPTPASGGIDGQEHLVDMCPNTIGSVQFGGLCYIRTEPRCSDFAIWTAIATGTAGDGYALGRSSRA
jgi:hypothetical protein